MSTFFKTEMVEFFKKPYVSKRALISTFTIIVKFVNVRNESRMLLFSKVERQRVLEKKTKTNLHLTGQRSIITKAHLK